MKRSFPHVLAAFYGSPWAILPEKLREIEAVLWRRIAGGAQRPEPVAFDDPSDYGVPRGESKPPYKMFGSAAVVAVHGTITPRPSLFADFSGGTSAEGIGRAVDAAAADPKADAIVLDVDSPGGSVYGLPEAASKIYAARKAKPVYAVADHMAASAAYWLATQAGDVAVTPAGTVGSIGVILAHVDDTKADEMAGLKTTIVSAGKFKAEGWVPLTEEAQADMQRQVDQYYQMFVSAVAKGRGIRDATVEKDFGQGRMKLADEAVSARMADRVATLEQVVNEVNKTRTDRTRRKVAADLAANGFPTA